MIPIIISAFILLIIILIWGGATNWQFFPSDKEPPQTPNDNKVLKGTLIGVGDDFKIINNGAIRIEKDVITQVGNATQVDTTNALVIDFGDGIISPGFINAHDHLSYNEAYPQTKPDITPGNPWIYDDRYRWQGLGSSQIQTSYPNGYSLNSMRAIEMYSSIRHLLGGTTSIMGSLVGSPGMLRDLSVDCTANAADIAAHVANPRYCKKDKNGNLYSPFSGFPIQAIGAGIEQVLPTAAAWKLRAATTVVDSGNIEPIQGVNNEQNNWNYNFINPEAKKDATLIHVGEGVDEYSTGEIDAALKSNFTKTNLSFIHATAINKDQIQEVAEKKINVIWSPRSNLSLYGYTTPVPDLIDAGVNVALSTDWVYSGSINLLREFKCALHAFNDYFNNDKGYEQLIKMVTINAAKATATSKYIGNIDIGKKADISVFKKNDTNPYKSIIDSSSKDVSMLMVNGDIVIINDEYINNLELYSCGDWSKGFMNECTSIPLNVCGVEKTLFSAYPWSVIRDTINTMYKQQYRALENSDDINTPAVLYPLYFCGDPYNEPICEWQSPTYGIPRDQVGKTGCFRYPCNNNCDQICGDPGGCMACMSNGKCECVAPTPQWDKTWCSSFMNQHMNSQWCEPKINL